MSLRDLRHAVDALSLPDLDQWLSSFVINHGASMLDMQDAFGESTLHILVEKVEVERVFLLIKHGASATLKNRKGYAPIHYLISGENEGSKLKELLDLLITNGETLNRECSFGSSLLSYAIKRRDVRLTKVLLQEGAGLAHGEDSSILCFAAGYGKEIFMCCEEFLQEKQKEMLDLDQRGRYQQTPLMHAAWNMKVDLVKYLIEKGADDALTDRSGKTALDFVEAAQINPSNVLAQQAIENYLKEVHLVRSERDQFSQIINDSGQPQKGMIEEGDSLRRSHAGPKYL